LSDLVHADLAHADLARAKIATGDERAFLAWLVAAVLLGISALGFYMWERANSGGNDAPFLAAVQHK
jgi:hypothetical protein